MKVFSISLLLIFLLLIATHQSYAINNNTEDKKRATLARLKQMNLKDLGQVQFYNPEAISAARKTQKLLETSAALFVITQEDIRRAGITHIAEALRLVPGIQVARFYANRWAIGTQGLNGFISSKLLVMIDGRTIYTTRNATVNWDIHNIFMEDIDRIEVIHGPGGSLWGANAVNGIINIVTKTAKQTQGNLVSTYLGKGEEQAIGGIRHGGDLKNGHYRVYGKIYEHDSFVSAQGEEQQDNWLIKRGGFRTDMSLSQRDNLTIQGDIYDGFTKRFFFSPEEQKALHHHTYINGFNLLARWQRDFSDGEMILQSYYDLTERDQTLIVKEKRGTYDIDFQHRWRISARQEFLWGLGFRYVHDDFESFSTIIRFDPSQRQRKTYSGFGQVELMLQPKRWKLTLGSKVEHNDYTGFEYQPTIRLLWTQQDKHNFWAAVSRAVRTPSRYDEDTEINVGLENLKITIFGNQNFQSEVLMAYELGYRFAPSHHFFLDLSAYYNDYDKLRTGEVSHLQAGSMIAKWDNQMTGEVYGLNMVAQWQITKIWRLITTYSYADVQLHLLPNSQSFFIGETEEGDTPHHQATLRSLLTLPYQMEFDTSLYYVDNLPNQNTPNYTRFDVRLGWQAKKNLSFSLGARNLFDSQHPEYGVGLKGNIEISDEVRRAFYMNMNYRF